MRLHFKMKVNIRQIFDWEELEFYTDRQHVIPNKLLK